MGGPRPGDRDLVSGHDGIGPEQDTAVERHLLRYHSEGERQVANGSFGVVLSKVPETMDWAWRLAILVVGVGAKGIEFRGKQRGEQT